MKITNLSKEQLNYLVAKSLNWQWRYPWLLAKEGYVSWKSTEDAWGAWHLNTAQAGPLSARS